jgi:hypothetical protein
MIYEPGIQQREESARLALATQHAQVCDQLGKPAGAPDRDNCLNLLDNLYINHQRAFIADSSEI